MPSELYLMWRQYPWPFGDYACDAKIVVTEAIIYASILTIVAFSCERYLAICHPLSPLSRSSTGQAKKMICFIWLVSFMSASPWAFFTKVNYLKYEGRILEESAWCSIPFNEETHGSLYMMLGSTLLYFFAPLFVVTLLYTRIGLTLHRSKIRRSAGSGGGGEGEAERTYLQGKRTVIKMLVVVVSSFFLCWSPFHSQRLMFVLVTLHGRWTKTLLSAQHILFITSGVFYYLNSALNPILYSVMSKRFRRGFSDIKQKLLRRVFHLPASLHSDDMGERKQDSPQGRPRHWIPAEQRHQIIMRVLGLPVPVPASNTSHQPADNPNTDPNISHSILGTPGYEGLIDGCCRSSSVIMISKFGHSEVRTVSEGTGKALSGLQSHRVYLTRNPWCE